MLLTSLSTQKENSTLWSWSPISYQIINPKRKFNPLIIFAIRPKQIPRTSWLTGDPRSPGAAACRLTWWAAREHPRHPSADRCESARTPQVLWWWGSPAETGWFLLVTQIVWTKCGMLCQAEMGRFIKVGWLMSRWLGCMEWLVRFFHQNMVKGGREWSGFIVKSNLEASTNTGIPPMSWSVWLVTKASPEMDLPTQATRQNANGFMCA